MWNLLTNAIKFTPRGGRITVRLRVNPAELVVSVIDTGAGIEPSVLPHVFQRFRQGEHGTSRDQGGLGLGLALVRHFVELHGGRVTASSDGPGRGADVPCDAAHSPNRPRVVLQSRRFSFSGEDRL